MSNGEIQRMDSGGNITSDRTFTGTRTFSSISLPNQSYTLNGMVTVTEKTGGGTGTVSAMNLSRTDACCRPTGGTLSVARTGGSHSGTHSLSFNATCGSANLDGTRRAQGPACDGEEYFALALFFAGRQWGEGPAPLDYSSQARTILRECLHKGEAGEGDPMWDPANHLIKFVPETPWTDPSYHLPHFYELFALWADEADRPLSVICRSRNEKSVR